MKATDSTQILFQTREVLHVRGAYPCSPLQAEDKEALLRKQAREARYKAAELSDKARRLRALAQKGVNNVMESTEDNK